MDFKDSVRASLDAADFLVNAYLGDLTPQEMLVRPVPSANHIAWQFGHLIKSERYLVEAAAPGSMPALPAGFAEQHTNDNAAKDDPTAFCTKEQYLAIARDVRAGTLKALAGMSDADLDKPVSKVPPFVKNAGQAMLFISAHWAHHSGHWVVVRRKLGRPRMF